MSYYSVVRSSNDLEHHGILGMKWGVRRYQNEDGSLTPAGEKRYNKNIKYRDKIVSRNNKKIENLSSKKKEADNAIKDLKKNGVNSETYKKWEERKRREYEYEEKEALRKASKIEDRDERLKAGMDASINRGFQNLELYMNRNTRLGDKKVAELMVEYSHRSSDYNTALNTLVNRNNAIANMPITALTSRRQIRRGV